MNLADLALGADLQPTDGRHPRQKAADAAKDAIAGGDPEAIRVACEELIKWSTTDLTPIEEGMITAAKLDASVYVAVPVSVAMRADMPGGIVSTPQGDFAAWMLQLTVPMAALRATKLLQADGQAPNPAEGMLGALDARWVLPRKRLAPRVLASIGAASESDVPLPLFPRGNAGEGL